MNQRLVQVVARTSNMKIFAKTTSAFSATITDVAGLDERDGDK